MSEISTMADAPELAGSQGVAGNKAPIAKTPSREDVERVVSEVGATHDGRLPNGKRPSGRPRKDGLPAGQAPNSEIGGKRNRVGNVAAPRPEPPRPSVDPEVISKTIKAVCAAVDGVITRRAHRIVLTLTKDEGLANALALDVAMTVEERDLIGSLAGQVCVQYGWAGQHAPAVLLGVVSIGYGFRVVVGFQKLNGLIVEAKKNAGSTVQPRELQTPRDGK